MAIVNAGIDYLRLTSKDKAQSEQLTAIWQSEIAYLEAANYIPRVWNFQGYGGLMCERVGIGARDDGMIYEAQGSQAGIMFERMRNAEFSGNTPRIDFCLDVQGSEEMARDFETIFHETSEAATRKTGTRTRNLSYVRQRDKVDTVNVGSRDSGAYLCIYDSGARHTELFDKPTRRYEVRYSNEFARSRFAQARSATSVACLSASLVIGHSMSVGIKRDWFADIPPMKPLHAYTKTDNDTSLAWIESHVAKTFRRLLANGYGPQLAKILGVKSLELVDDSE